MAKNGKVALPQDLQEAGQKVLLAGLGALSVAETEGKKYFEKLVRKGKKYDGPGREQVDELLHELDERLEEVRKDVDQRTLRARKSVDEQVDRARRVVDEAWEGFEARMQEAVTAALRGLGIPTRDEIEGLRRSVQQLAKNLDALRHEQAIREEAAPAVEAHAVGGGWYEVRVRGVVVEKVRGEDEAAAVVARLQQEDAALTTPEREAGVEAVPVGGSWYQVKVDGLVVEKVQGKEAAEAAVAKYRAQQPA